MDAANVTILWTPAALVGSSVILGLVADVSHRRAFGIVAIAIGLFSASAVCVYTALTTSVNPAFGGLLLGGGGFAGLASVIYALSGLSVLSGWGRVTTSEKGGTVVAITALSAIAIQVLASSFDLLTAVLALEIVALAGYALVSATGSRRSDEAAIRYFVQGSTAAGFTVLGLAVLYGMYGHTAYALLNSSVDGGSQPALFAMVLLLAAFAFKLGAVPFHTWAPDVYETTDPATAGFLASAPKIGAFAALLVLFPGAVFIETAFPGARLALVVIATASIVIGNLGALRQSSFGRMLGYSGIAQVGYGLIGVAAGVSAITAVAVFGVTYAIGAASAFFAAEAIRSRRPSWDGSIVGLEGLAGESPLLAAALTASVLSLTGIPLFIGFWGKLLVFISAVSGGLTWLAVVGVVGSVVSFGYYGNVIRTAYSGLPEKAEPAAGDERSHHGRMSLAAAVIAALLVVVGGTGPVIAGVDALYKLLTF
jgi:NADH-quinone oxidoreductase subunit N